MRFTAILLALLASVLGGGCATNSSAGTNEYVLVYLKRGPNAQDKTEEERNAIQHAHLANIGRLAEQGKLLIAGPFGEQNHDPTQRGLFIFDVRTIEEATALTNTDPAVQAGVLALEPHLMRSARDLHPVLKAELKLMEDANRSGEPIDRASRLRMYVLLRADDAEKADAVVFDKTKVYFAARVDGTHGFYVLDAKEISTIRGELGESMKSMGPLTLDQWLATQQLALIR